MSHLHIPDGILPLPMIAAGFALTALLIWLASRRLSRSEGARVAPRIATLAALMLVAMSLPLPVLGYHVNLTVLTGIIAGPAAGFVAAFITNLILALTAHGGITVLGLNALIAGIEVNLGWFLWSWFRRVLKRPSAAAALAVIVTLAVSTTAMFAVVASSRISPELFLHRHEHHEAAQESEPYAESAVDHDRDHEHDHDHDHETENAVPLRTFAAVVFSAAAIGWVIEAVIVGALVGFIARTRPDMLSGGNFRGV